MTASSSKAWVWSGTAVSAVGAAVCLLLGGAGRWAALAGVLCAAGTFAFAVWMKGWAVRKNLDAALMTLAATFGLRLIAAGGGTTAAYMAGHAEAFVAGFFGAFLPLMALEMGYVLSAQKATAQGSVT
ncbi:MAG: hypothetical protein RL653_577 [Pseudomonadota bacterium]|jgi:hypothetical protein